MTEGLEHFDGLVDAEKDEIWGSATYTDTDWGDGASSELAKWDAVTYNGNPSVRLNDGSGTDNGPGYALDTQVSVGSALAYRLWAAIRAPSAMDTYPIRLGLLRYDENGDLVDAVYTEYQTEDYEGAWSVVETVLPTGGCAFVRPFIAIHDDGSTLYVGMLNAVDIRPSCSVGFASSASMTSAAGAWVTLPFDTEDFDNGDVYDNVTNYRFTAPFAGLYSVNLNPMVYKATAPDCGFMEVAIYKNGSFWRYALVCNSKLFTNNGSVYGVASSFSETTELAAGDLLQVKRRHDDSGTLYFSLNCRFSIFALK